MTTITGAPHGERGGGSPVKVVVRFNDDPVAGITVTAAAAAGSEDFAKSTGEDGIASFTLDAGSYTFTATSGSGTATETADVVESTTPVIVALALA